jgi:hypothetical protein
LRARVNNRASLAEIGGDDQRRDYFARKVSI